MHWHGTDVRYGKRRRVRPFYVCAVIFKIHLRLLSRCICLKQHTIHRARSPRPMGNWGWGLNSRAFWLTFWSWSRTRSKPAQPHVVPYHNCFVALDQGQASSGSSSNQSQSISSNTNDPPPQHTQTDDQCLGMSGMHFFKRISWWAVAV